MTLNFERMPWAGSLVLVACTVPALLLLLLPIDDFAPMSLRGPLEKGRNRSADMRFSLSSEFSGLMPGISQEQISFSKDPSRPDRQGKTNQFLIRLRNSRQMKRVEMPVALGLAFDSAGSLQFSNDSSAFWLECKLLENQTLSAALIVRTPAGEVITHAEWIPVPMETPLQTAEEFPSDNPFRELLESRWLGPDLLRQKIHGEVVHRLEVGSPPTVRVIDCRVGDWLTHNGKGWEKCGPPRLIEEEKNPIDQNPPLAHIQTSTAQFLEIEGWNEMSHVRFRWNLAATSPCKIKTEELFSQIRVRSEKQVSCMMDKQCFVLRPGDFVLKANGRWKALRKTEEKEALLTGELVGELFILEKIGMTPGGKNIVGSYFSPNRVQLVPIELTQKAKKSRKGNR
jgi:hypothetical protein